MANIELQESVVSRLTAQAAAEGLTLADYLTKLSELGWPATTPRLTGDELDRLLDAEARDDSTYQGTYPRTDIYLDHD